MIDLIISVRNLHKAYRVYSHPSKMVAEVLTGQPHHREFVALENINFDVHSGTVVGLLGRNGAGKSTLLRIVARTLDASGGTVITRGRIAAILELGTGFHLDYTGRENIYFGGICLGLSRREMRERINEIIAFSELEDFIDQPFRTYSTGMQARLTFSVATCVDPDILIIDEALTVGDARFQLKSFDRIREFKRRGKAILLVSHSINQITAFCDHAILLDHGRMLAQGDPNRVGNIYHELLFGEEVQSPLPPAPVIEPVSAVETPSVSLEQSLPLDCAVELPREHRYGNGAARIVAVEIRDLHGRRRSRLRSLENYEILMTIRVNRSITNLCYGILVRDARGLELFGTDSRELSDWRLGAHQPGDEIEAKLRFRANLTEGRYFLTAAIAKLDETKYDMRFDVVEFEVESTPGIYHASIVNLEAEFALGACSSVSTVPSIASPDGTSDLRRVAGSVPPEGQKWANSDNLR